jgi:hypothetical protein
LEISAGLQGSLTGKYAKNSAVQHSVQILQAADCNKVRSSDNTPLIPLLDFDVQAIEHGVDATAEQHI